MRSSWKLALIGGEVTVLAAFTGVGIHLAMQPHNAAFRPPALSLPLPNPGLAPAPTLAVTTSESPAAKPSSQPAPGPDLLRKFGEQDRHLLLEQWVILRRLTGAIERYVEERVRDQIDRHR